jgi:hypothetical protein
LVSCANALAAIAPEDEKANEALLSMLNSPIPSLRGVALNNVASIKGRKMALPSVINIATSSREITGNRIKAVKLLPSIVDENTKKKTAKALESIRFDGEPSIRDAVDAALKKLE